MTKHTEGPWKAKRTHQMSEDAWYVIVDPAGRGPIIDVGGKDENGQIGEMKYLITDPAEIEANANLIAAAPDLLEALVQAVRELDYMKKYDDCLACPFEEKARAAIAKAEGRS